MSKLYITDTILRDAHQSQAATRMTTEEMLPACKILDDIGYWSLECWGGATFDSCMRFLNEDPWERLRTLKRAMPKTKLQMLFRGQNILGYKHYADDVVAQFCKKSIENGIDVVRVFDALNDTRNMEVAIKFVKEYGGIAEAALSYTTSPVHDEEYFVRMAIELEKMGANIKTEGRVAIVEGVGKLTGATCKSCDLRGGAALITAAVGAEGRSIISNIHYIDRGYDDVVNKLKLLNADIEYRTKD